MTPSPSSPVPRTLPSVTLVIGGARSGKSRYGEELIMALPKPWTYIATAEARDNEMRARIAQHAARRGDGWRTREIPLELATAILEEASSASPALVDCLTLWLSNVMLAGRDVSTEMSKLLNALKSTSGPIVLISNEVGLGLVPETALGRAFRDAQGQLNASVAGLADHVVFVAAGLPLVLKPRT